MNSGDHPAFPAQQEFQPLISFCPIITIPSYENVNSTQLNFNLNLSVSYSSIQQLKNMNTNIYQDRVDVLTNAVDEVVGQMTKANVAIKTCHRYVKQDNKLFIKWNAAFNNVSKS